MGVCGFPSALKHPATDAERLSVNEQAAFGKRNAVVLRELLDAGTEDLALACPNVDQCGSKPFSEAFGPWVC